MRGGTFPTAMTAFLAPAFTASNLIGQPRCTAGISARSRQLCERTAIPAPTRIAVMYSTFHTGVARNYHVAEEPVTYRRPRVAVYLDTSIPSYLSARMNSDLSVARRQRITRIWWDRYRDNYELRISDQVVAEASDGDPSAASARMHVLSSVPVLSPAPLALQLVDRLIDGGQLPPKARADAEHVAIAAVHSVRFLLTWNCKHLANATIARNVARTCEALGLTCPEICTPERLLRAYNHERLNPR